MAGSRGAPQRGTRLEAGFAAPLALAVILGALIGVGVFTFGYARGSSYITNSPQACANCHIMRRQYDSWQKASHHGAATCVDCHLPHSFFAKYLAKAKALERKVLALEIQGRKHDAENRLLRKAVVELREQVGAQWI